MARTQKMKMEDTLMIIIVVLIVLVVLYWLFSSMKHNIHESFYAEKHEEDSFKNGTWKKYVINPDKPDYTWSNTKSYKMKNDKDTKKAFKDFFDKNKEGYYWIKDKTKNEPGSAVVHQGDKDENYFKPTTPRRTTPRPTTTPRPVPKAPTTTLKPVYVMPNKLTISDPSKWSQCKDFKTNNSELTATCQNRDGPEFNQSFGKYYDTACNNNTTPCCSEFAHVYGWLQAKCNFVEARDAWSKRLHVFLDPSQNEYGIHHCGHRGLEYGCKKSDGTYGCCPERRSDLPKPPG